mmetsp:Transcript_7814/g.10956  ORF Transcript_7814/g.10956 Transcript_7814/m.10956 type:complete len:234 (-) Transcript_7814:1-702(-)
MYFLVGFTVVVGALGMYTLLRSFRPWSAAEVRESLERNFTHMMEVYRDFFKMTPKKIRFKPIPLPETSPNVIKNLYPDDEGAEEESGDEGEFDGMENYYSKTTTPFQWLSSSTKKQTTNSGSKRDIAMSYRSRATPRQPFAENWRRNEHKIVSGKRTFEVSGKRTFEVSEVKAMEDEEVIINEKKRRENENEPPDLRQLKRRHLSRPTPPPASSDENMDSDEYGSPGCKNNLF